VNCREAKTAGGIMGSGWRRSTHTKATAAASPAAPATATAGDASSAPISAYVTSASASAPRPAPATSNRPCLPPPEDSGTWRTATGTHTRATGTLIRNTQRQPGPSTSQPLRNGPTAAPIPPKPDHRPTARPRSSGWKDAWMRASEPGVSRAPPTPCSARAAISVPASGASPHSREAVANHTTPTTNTLRRPNRSPSAPPSRISPASVTMYALTVHWRAARSASRSRPMRGRATLTTVESSMAMPEPRTVVSRIHRPCGEASRTSDIFGAYGRTRHRGGCRVLPRVVPLSGHLMRVPVERRCRQASTTRAAIDASASLPQVRGS
jgi:hypothetical protein